MCVYVNTGTHSHVPWHICGGQKTALRSWFFMWILGIELSLLHLAAGTFDHLAILQFPRKDFY